MPTAPRWVPLALTLLERQVSGACPFPSPLMLPCGFAALEMNARLSRAEFWLLSRLAVFAQSLRALGLPEGPPWGHATLDTAFNCRGHGLAPDAFARCVHGAVRKGWIQLSRDGRTVDRLPSLSTMRSLLSEPGVFAEGARAVLSALGGEVWEAFARPEWSRYIDDCMTFEAGTGAELREVTTVDRAWLRCYQDAVRAEQSLDRESVFEIDDWQMTYWKPPVAAHRWTFRAQGPRRPIEQSSNCLQSLWCEWR